MGTVVDLEGLILSRRGFGYCKVTASIGNKVRLQFAGNEREVWYAQQALASADFDWQSLPVGLKCRTSDGRVCTIVDGSFQPNTVHHAYDYVVAFDGAAAETARLTERELWPLSESVVETPASKLVGLKGDTLDQFRARERLLAAVRHIDRESSGLRALAAARIQLFPHQAFVVGTVTADDEWRYILADEVGLGKTVEAGAIAHHLLSQKPHARILVLTPGALARQWLCEMRQSFGGREFRLLDLHQFKDVSLQAWPLVISSLKTARRKFAHEIVQTAWDLVIVDEAHQLLWSEAYYSFVAEIAEKTPKLLLLSAVPARERDTEFLQLLRLLDAKKYQSGGYVSRIFSALYAAQASIGRRLRIVSRQLNDQVEVNRAQLDDDVTRLLATDLLADDEELTTIQNQARQAPTSAEAIPVYRHLIDQVIDRYRISRRLIKNRRTRLIESNLLLEIQRTSEIIHYEPSELESKAETLVIDLLRSLGGTGQTLALQLLYRKCAQALCDPVALYEIASNLAAVEPSEAAVGNEFDLSSVYDYDEHDALLESCATALAKEVHRPVLGQLVSLLRVCLGDGSALRANTLLRYLQGRIQGGAEKILVFAGTPGTANFVSSFLVHHLGNSAVATFLHELTDEEKETQATRFRRDPRCLVLVSDESGGEGRNFQFADELVHYDLPWSVAAIEQRVGRLDRVGRSKPVHSVAIVPRGGLEAEWAACLDSGFKVFNRSISGLEFMLNGAERRVIQRALEESADSLQDLLLELADASERERALDDAEALTDAASFRRSSRHLRSLDGDSDVRLESALPAYLQSIATRRAAKRVTDKKDPGLQVWSLRLDEVADYKLKGVTQGSDGTSSEYLGTFSRSTARDRIDLDFFSVGHPAVDALLDAARGHIRGRVVLAEVCTSQIDPSVLLLCGWRMQAPLSFTPLGLSHEADRVLRNRIIWTLTDFLSSESRAASLQTLLTLVLSPVSAVRGWAHDSALKVLRPEPGAWSERVNAAMQVGRLQAREIYEEKYRLIDARFCDEALALFEQRSLVARADDPVSPDYLSERVSAVRAAELDLDAAVLVHVLPEAP